MMVIANNCRVLRETCMRRKRLKKALHIFVWLPWSWTLHDTRLKYWDQIKATHAFSRIFTFCILYFEWPTIFFVSHEFQFEIESFSEMINLGVHNLRGNCSNLFYGFRKQIGRLYQAYLISAFDWTLLLRALSLCRRRKFQDIVHSRFDYTYHRYQLSQVKNKPSS